VRAREGTLRQRGGALGCAHASKPRPPRRARLGAAGIAAV